MHRDHSFDPNGINSGAEMATLFLCRFLAKLGHKVVLAGQFPAAVKAYGEIECWNLGETYDVQSIIKKAGVELGSYHLISAGRAIPLLLSQNETACLSRSLISHDRSSNDTGIDAKVLSKIADHIFCVSEAQREFFLKDGVPSEKLTVIHNGVDLELFKASDYTKRNPNRLIFVGALVVDKGLHLLLEAYAKLKSKHQDLTLDVYGSSDLWRRGEYLNPQEIEKNLPGVKFHGKVAQQVISQAMQTAGMCVIPSIWFDPFPLVSIDAQATGCPVIAFDVGGLKEGIVDGQTGRVIKEVSSDRLCEALDEILSDRAKWQSLSQNALAISRPRFTWEKLTERVIARARSAKAGSAKQHPKIGLFSTWHQQCGLATYANYLFNEVSKENFIVLAENTSESLTSPDETNVFRCWNKEKTDFAKIKALIKEHQVQVLFFNFHTHYRLFNQAELSAFLRDIRKSGVVVVAHLHNTFTLDKTLIEFVAEVDQVITLSPENRLEAIANGIHPQKVSSVPHGVFSPALNVDKSALRSKLNIANDQKVISCFGFVQAHKGIEELIQSIAHLRGRNINAHGYILGITNKGDPNSNKYLQYLKKLGSDLKVQNYIHFSERFLSNEEVSHYLAASDIVLMNYKSQHYEASGACSLAIGAGALVVASLAPPFTPFKDAVWHVTSGFNVALSIELLLSNSELANEVLANAREYREQYSWKNIASLLAEKFTELTAGKFLSFQDEVKAPAANLTLKSSEAPLRVLMQNRSNTFTQRGGDTILMEKTIAGLEKKGVKVTVDVEGKEDPKNYDLVHLFNFVLSDLIKYYGERAKQAGVPFVVTTLHEEISRFHNPSVVKSQQLIEYVKFGQSKSWYESNKIDLNSIPACANFDNTWAVKNATALIVNGKEEANGLKANYPFANNLHVVPVGYDIGAEGNADDFYKEYGVRDFIFCVGRLESRKNQLMLIKAFEDSELPIVFAGGGFTYQPDYDRAVRNFKRKGKTIVLDKLSPHMLASAYRAARVHALPSWYELPGLVSLEAAYYGCNVVVTDFGTARSYFADQAFYCEPGSESSILQTVLAAYNSPQKTGLKEVSMKYTWENAADKTLETYNTALGREQSSEPIINQGAYMEQNPSTVQVFDLDSDATRFQEMLERGEMAAKEKDLQRADKYLTEAEFLNPNSVRLLRAKGAVTLAQGYVEKAKEYFEHGIKIDGNVSRLYSGLGMCEMQMQNLEKAHGLFVRALELSPTELVAVLQLLECSYALNKYEDLEKVLRRYLADHADDVQMRYCLAGCLFKQNKFGDADIIVSELLQKDPSNLGAKQLKSAISEAGVPQTAEPGKPVPAPQAAVQAPSMPGMKFQAAAPAQVQAKQESIAIDPAEIVFDSTDREITEIEEMKRIKNYKEVLTRSKNKLQSTNLRADQKEKLELLLSEAEVLQGNTKDAEARYEKILSQNPTSARAMCGKGAIAASRGEWAVARDFFEKANKINPAYDVAWAGLGIYNLSINDREKAWDCFKHAIDINPENIRALLGIIELGYSLRRLDEVERVIKMYLEMHPLDLNFLYSLAGCYFAQDRLQEAKSELDKIRMFEPENRNALELVELIEAKQGTLGANA